MQAPLNSTRVRVQCISEVSEVAARSCVEMTFDNGVGG